MKHLLLMAVLLAGCEGDATKLERLQQGLMNAQLEIGWWSGQASTITESHPNYKLITDSLKAAQIRLDLARRDLNKFMNGR